MNTKLMDISFAKKKAQDILRFYKMPSDVIGLAKSCGFLVAVANIETAVTIYNERTGKYAILYNDLLEEKEINEAVAHELGHIFLGHLKNGNLVKMGALNEKGYDMVEDMADAFAEALLNA
jgi:Zn-dependent peptidase ImmA (M78 family)